ncbi:GbpC/Spa domain-containing protein [Lactococcus insecticola]|uniref:Uncharacterized protein n=1 Tax=Pseudolactococcus insecticola TaxID=2709158 RepID=A0A6A0B7Q9_9LACT|nr:GbpC/Spa domain-containing protein [Lactococcus insecticola]GFH40815.1 hypothetical protein Hs20B_12130 [Lactococcus insecticola]
MFKNNIKNTHFRQWKSGKRWLYASSALAVLVGSEIASSTILPLMNNHAVVYADQNDVASAKTALTNAVTAADNAGVNVVRDPTITSQIGDEAKINADYAAQTKDVQAAIAQLNDIKSKNAATKAAYDAKMADYNAKLATYNAQVVAAKDAAGTTGNFNEVLNSMLNFKNEPNANISVSGGNYISAVAFQLQYQRNDLNGDPNTSGMLNGHTLNDVEYASNSYSATPQLNAAGGVAVETSIGQIITVTYTGLDNSDFGGKKISKVVFQYILRSTPSPDGHAVFQLHKDPTDGITQGAQNPNGSTNDLATDVNIAFYTDDGERVSFSSADPAVFTFASLNNNSITNGIEKVNNFNGTFKTIAGSSVGIHGDYAYSENDNDWVSKGAAMDVTQWDGVSGRMYYGAIGGQVTSGDYVGLTFRTSVPGLTAWQNEHNNMILAQWFQINTRTAAGGIVSKPLKPTPPTYLPEDVTVHYQLYTNIPTVTSPNPPTPPTVSEVVNPPAGPNLPDSPSLDGSTPPKLGTLPLSPDLSLPDSPDAPPLPKAPALGTEVAPKLGATPNVPKLTLPNAPTVTLPKAPATPTLPSYTKLGKIPDSPEVPKLPVPPTFKPLSDNKAPVKDILDGDGKSINGKTTLTDTQWNWVISQEIGGTATQYTDFTKYVQAVKDWKATVDKLISDYNTAYAAYSPAYDKVVSDYLDAYQKYSDQYDATVSAYNTVYNTYSSDYDAKKTAYDAAYKQYAADYLKAVNDYDDAYDNYSDGFDKVVNAYNAAYTKYKTAMTSDISDYNSAYSAYSTKYDAAVSKYNTAYDAYVTKFQTAVSDYLAKYATYSDNYDKIVNTYNTAYAAYAADFKDNAGDYTEAYAAYSTAYDKAVADYNTAYAAYVAKYNSVVSAYNADYAQYKIDYADYKAKWEIYDDAGGTDDLVSMAKPRVFAGVKPKIDYDDKESADSAGKVVAKLKIPAKDAKDPLSSSKADAKATLAAKVAKVAIPDISEKATLPVKSKEEELSDPDDKLKLDVKATKATFAAKTAKETIPAKAVKAVITAPATPDTDISNFLITKAVIVDTFDTSKVSLPDISKVTATDKSGTKLTTSQIKFAYKTIDATHVQLVATFQDAFVKSDAFYNNKYAITIPTLSNIDDQSKADKDMKFINIAESDIPDPDPDGTTPDTPEKSNEVPITPKYTDSTIHKSELTADGKKADDKYNLAAHDDFFDEQIDYVLSNHADYTDIQLTENWESVKYVPLKNITFKDNDGKAIAGSIKVLNSKGEDVTTDYEAKKFQKDGVKETLKIVFTVKDPTQFTRAQGDDLKITEYVDNATLKGATVSEEHNYLQSDGTIYVPDTANLTWTDKTPEDGDKGTKTIKSNEVGVLPPTPKKPEKPVKTVTDGKNSLDGKTATTDKHLIFDVAQEVPKTDVTAGYQTFVMHDEVPAEVNILSVKLVDETGKDATDRLDLKVTGHTITATAKATLLNDMQSSFYNHTYHIVVDTLENIDDQTKKPADMVVENEADTTGKLIDDKSWTDKTNKTKTTPVYTEPSIHKSELTADGKKADDKYNLAAHDDFFDEQIDYVLSNHADYTDIQLTENWESVKYVPLKNITFKDNDGKVIAGSIKVLNSKGEDVTTDYEAKKFQKDGVKETLKIIFTVKDPTQFTRAQGDDLKITEYVDNATLKGATAAEEINYLQSDGTIYVPDTADLTWSDKTPKDGDKGTTTIKSNEVAVLPPAIDPDVDKYVENNPADDGTKGLMDDTGESESDKQTDDKTEQASSNASQTDNSTLDGQIARANELMKSYPAVPAVQTKVDAVMALFDKSGALETTTYDKLKTALDELESAIATAKATTDTTSK